MPGVSSDVVPYESLLEGSLELVEKGEASDWLSVEDPGTEAAQSLHHQTAGRIQDFVLLEGGVQEVPHPAQPPLLHVEDVQSDVSLRQGNQAPPQTRLGRQ